MRALGKRTTLLIALAAVALGWVFLMSLDLSEQGSSTGGDGSQADITYIDDSDFSQVTAYVSVADSLGQAIAGLEQSAFKLTEDQIAVEVKSFIAAGEQPIVAVLLIDHSGSMGRAGKMEGARIAAKTFVEQLQDGRDRIGVTAFDHQQSTLYGLNLISAGDRAALNSRIDGLTDQGGTAFFDAIYDAVGQLESQSGRKVIVAMTDGIDENSRHSLGSIIERAQESELPVYTVGLGADVEGAVLERIANETGGEYHYSPTSGELAALYRDIAQALQNEYSLTYTSPTPHRDGTQRDVALIVTHPGAALDASGTYSPGGVLSVGLNLPLFFGLAIPLVALLFVPRWRQSRKRKREIGPEPAPRPAADYPPAPYPPQSQTYSPSPATYPPPPAPYSPSPYSQGAPPGYAPPSTPQASAQQSIRCPRCGAQLRPQAKFCGSCGLKRTPQ